MDYLKNKGIIPNVMGGLGNQIFIIMAAYIAHKLHNCPLYIFENNISNNKHNLNKFNYNNTLFKYFGIHTNNIFDELFLKSNGYIMHYLSHDDGFKAWKPHDLKPGTITSSYYQYYPTIKTYESEIRNLLLKGLEEHINKKTISDPDTSAFLHIRRGDYLNHPNIHFIQPLEYYKKSVNYLCENRKINKIYIFSDDMEWVNSEPFFSSDIFEIINSKDELYCLHLMSQCKGGAICANSTFSWWGAFLGAYSERNIVIIPNKWISYNIESLFPEEWIKV
jgi:hypothetical protein